MGELSEANFIHALNCHPKIGSQTIKKLINRFHTASRVWQVNESEIISFFDERVASLVKEAKAQFDPEFELDKLTSIDIGYVTIDDEDYPNNLRELPDAPAILYLKGDPNALKIRSVSVVGSRKYTNYGAQVCYKIVKECANSGLAIISGLALGIDAIAHRACVDAKGITIGVLGCGLDAVYPVSNQQLANEMLDNGGLLVSEFPPGTPPMKQNFPARNRIIAGLSSGTLVIEAAEKSGALITAYLAIEYNRDVYAIPGNIDSESSAGCNKLIKEGAKLIINANDVLEEFGINEKSASVKQKQIELEGDEKIIYDLLSEKIDSPDEICKHSGLNVISVNMVLTSLELQGLVKNIGGGRFRIN